MFALTPTIGTIDCPVERSKAARDLFEVEGRLLVGGASGKPGVLGFLWSLLPGAARRAEHRGMAGLTAARLMRLHPELSAGSGQELLTDAEAVRKARAAIVGAAD